MRGNEIINGHPIRCYDNGGETADRYTVYYMDEPVTWRHGSGHSCRGMSFDPFMPNGVGMYCSGMIGPHTTDTGYRSLTCPPTVRNS